MTIPSEGTIKRCAHSIYFPSFNPDKPDALNPACELCTPERPSNGRDYAKFRMPARGALNERQNIRANEHNPGACDVCGSLIHFETDNPRIWECADCGAKFKARNT